ncbi:malto-oligosyltrehalose synthase [Dyadobacter sp. CY261]|uniref:malto-oligosyltrehalose synthase n=1 Tax=Dyadobacter sp. CY261 TaxID=2907203 RepID=UPI001F2F9778|nr:malto-oligosyltrehalose synthase [Dyadobacter sp. CY261]MCF0068914.1 malto-oligosyltrehalose synthase [Dyadobacter sp. CY261]
MYHPVSTYRLQFHKDFSFQEFEPLIPYFRKLGVGTIYASPILASTTGSTHGYDGVDPTRIDPEIGTLNNLKSISANLRESGIGWLQDIVPNHMAFHAENDWLMDVLEKGKQSVYASYFDIAWNSALFQGKLMVPFLSKDQDEMIEAREVGVIYNDNRFKLDFGGLAFPLNLRSYGVILENVKDTSQALSQLLVQLKEMNQVEDASAFSQRWNEWLLQLRALYTEEQLRPAIDEALSIMNADAAQLRTLADQQNYVLCHWQRTEKQINFRRFFTVNGLICLNIQDDAVFEKYHEFTRQLTEEGIFQGIRIDHIDGLFDPSGYLEKLREEFGNETYIVAEKILGENEDLPDQWPIQGTTGYEFLAVLNNLFTNQSAEKPFTDYYNELTGDDRPVRELLLSKKNDILYEHMAGELDNLFQLFMKLELADNETIERIGGELIRQVIGEFLIHCPVYRYYGKVLPLSDEESQAVKHIFVDINKHHLDLSPAVEVLEQCFIHRPILGDEDYNRRAAEFYQRCMQFTGPLMAKGGEDTLMYTYNRFIGHNDVGDFPDRFGMKTSDFHQYMKKRRKYWPMALNGTSTHDTKRGEDVRARLNVLTDLSSEWIEKVKEWQQANGGLKQSGQGPDANDEYLIYQTIAGAYPMPGEDEDDFPKRLGEYLQKALREAKNNSSWSAPNEAYEKETSDFASSLLKEGSGFPASFHAFLESLTDFGIINSLAQVVLKFTCPGVPDVYQGCELWDLSLVDPDNRRKVDFVKRKQWLDELESYETDRLVEKLWKSRHNGEVKLWLTQRLFALRRQYPLLFTQGEYIPLKVRGTYKDNLLAFARRYKRDVFVTVVPLHTVVMSREQQKEFFELDWQDTHVVLPENLLPEWDNVLTNSQAEFQKKLSPADLFGSLPLAILKGKRAENERNAGLLLHITSLPSPFGIGDIGPAAFEFAEFLGKANQKIWQILPLNPTEASQGNSPYSAISSRAGNPLLISPEVLAEQGLLPGEELAQYHLPESSTVDFAAAWDTKRTLLKKAFEHYNDHPGEDAAELDVFTEKNAIWLDDFALYMVLKDRFDNQPWYTWPEEFRHREQEALDEVRESEVAQIHFIKWQQFVFDKQWKKLRQYCNEREIKFLGDIPFYVSYDSADVWADRELFCVDDDGKITGIAGVPPDAFSEDGQLWGMPVFNWGALKAQDYQWWVDRLSRNMEMFDLVRLDHFRAFADYWEVPGGEETAINGSWKIGPGEDFFRKIEAALGQLPFIAEDLGEISPEVYALRDKFSLPGMKVLQFAFDEHMAQSDHIPHHFKHNFIGYTGTHDNNTTKGWFRELAASGVRERLESYLGKEISEDNVARELARSVFSSVAKTAILPIQDLLNLDESAKMNLPGSNENNWAWRLQPGQIDEEAAEFLSTITLLYNRE